MTRQQQLENNYSNLTAEEREELLFLNTGYEEEGGEAHIQSIRDLG